MTRPATDTDDDVPTAPKAMLFCWECDHSAPIDGDWVVRPREDRLAYVCPGCKTTLTTRPRRAEPSGERGTPEPAATLRRAIRASMAVWWASVDRGCSSLATLLEAGSAVGTRSRSEREYPAA